jgi:hypothetical protein
MYPSFDTRRVLCKQQRNHRVKPMRARRKQRSANAVAPPLSANREEDFVAIVQVSAHAIWTGKERRLENRVFVVIATFLLSPNRGEDFAKVAHQATKTNIENEKAKIRNGLRKEGNTKKDTELLINTRKSAGHTSGPITITSAKNKEHGTMLTTGQHHIYAPVKFATNNTFQEYHLARFVQNNAKSMTPLVGHEPFTLLLFCKGEGKSANTENATPIRLRLTGSIGESCHTSE